MPSFLLKTYEIVDEKKYDHIISWTEEGDKFIIKKLSDFSEIILPKYFKHNNFSSFIRQLNMYDFHKTKKETGAQCFEHGLFLREKKHLLQDIKRKQAAKKAKRKSKANSKEKVLPAKRPPNNPTS